MFKSLELSWDLRVERRKAFAISQMNGAAVHKWLVSDREINDEDTESLGFYRRKRNQLNGQAGELRNFEVHSVRPVRRIGPDGQQRTDLVIEITQSWVPGGSGIFRGGCTLIIDLEKRSIRYVVRKRVGHTARMQAQAAFQMELTKTNFGFSYYGDRAALREPFALLHRQI
jgi:hypothetical protein